MSDLIPLSKFRNEVAQYDPEMLLQKCSYLSRLLDEKGETVFTGSTPRRFGRFSLRQEFAITHHNLAMLSMLALRQHRWSRGQQPRDSDVIRLANNSDHIKDPFLENDNILMTLVRIAYKQWPFQENIYYSVPRHLSLYLDTYIPNSRIAPANSFFEKTGITVRDFMIIGLLMYAAALKNHTFNRGFLENTKEPIFKPYVTPEKLDAFLSLAGADFGTFRQLCLNEERQDPKDSPYRFNPLFMRPVIIRRDGQLCLPVPRLVVHRVTKGLYYDFLDAFSGRHNLFADWFGHAFQEYGGLLLDACFGDDVYPEPRYDKEEKRGPDWIVVRGNNALVLEFRSGRLHKMAKTHADYSDIINLLRRNIVDTVSKLPQKIADLKSGRAGIPCGGVTNYLPAVVTYDPLYPHDLILKLVKQELADLVVSDFDFELMSIEDLEWLLAWSPQGDPIDLLVEKRSNKATKDEGLSHFVSERAKAENIGRLRNSFLEQTLSCYLGKLWPCPSFGDSPHS